MSDTLTDSHAFATIWGSPGARARVRGLIRLVWPLLVLLPLGGYLVRATLPSPPLPQTAAACLLAILAFALAVQLQRSRSQLAAYMKGARGEEMVAHLLGFLPAGYRVFHGGDPQPGQPDLDYDHVAVGPSGLFAIETKNWEGIIEPVDGRILCNGSEPSRPPLEQVKHTANQLRKMLATHGVDHPALEITPVLCFAGSLPQGGTQGVNGVMLCHATELNALILACKDSPLGEETIDAASAALVTHYPTREASHA
jgi:hypothetical protein